ncbi:unnamed protein product, partial [Arabidopsis lyrata]
GKV